MNHNSTFASRAVGVRGADPRRCPATPAVRTRLAGRSPSPRGWQAALLVAVVLSSASRVGAATTIVTTYAYNADGALTAVTTQSGDEAPSTVYVAWDNFVPDAGNPASGSVRAGNGNLLSMAPSLGGGDPLRQLSYDERSRLVGCGLDGGPLATYGYDASSLLASTSLATGDVLMLYHGAAALLTNQVQPSTAATASFLGPVRYLGDGSEQTLLRPRKDTVALYQGSSELLAPYDDDPYGAPRTAPPAGEGLSPDASRYDLSYNPLQYAGEYREPTCGAYYLRARWYLPDQQTFVSRDPVDPVQRYGYAGGNPVSRTDPSGLTYRTYQRGVAGFLKKLGIAEAVLSALPWVGPAMSLLQASAVGAFWHDRNAAATLGFMGLWAGAGVFLELPAFERVVGAAQAFRGRVASDSFVALAQSAQAGFVGRHQRFDPAIFGENVAAAAAGILGGRFGAGIGYNPYSLDRAEVEEMLQEHYLHSDPGDLSVLVFVERSKRGGSHGSWTTPWMEKTHLGYYHARVLGFEVDDPFSGMVHESEVSPLPRDLGVDGVHARAGRYWRLDRDPDEDLAGSYRFVGKFQRSDVETAFRSNPLGLTSVNRQWRSMLETGGGLPSGFDPWRANCQDHAAGVIEALQSMTARR